MERGRWLVTGAAGRIGSALRRHLAERGVPLRSLDLSAPEPFDDDEVSAVDLRDLDGMVRAAAGCVGILHLGGLSDEADFHDLAEVNIVGGYHVLEAARRNGIARVVVAGSNRVTGMYPAGETVAPGMPTRPDGFYGVAKVAGEALCRLYADKFGMITVTVRIGSYEDRPTSQRELRTWLSPEDALRAFDAAMETTEAGAVFYAVSANSERWWSLDEGARLGYVPRDDATQVAGFEAEPYPVSNPQAGPYASAQFSMARMKR
ncbi:uronate dehydrogenase [Microbacterium resistens]|uniref:Uronate dehydrogenase n=1 Tax=Microbacterium resistens TaxID=156977 RepID=A0ABU1S945_9MICO|nr:NAD(P)-dependent oxidoreductase [Microbacterium resistens]MDR6866126.1 uronate dehydrogenase [Microbacterium resistens]